MTDYLDDARKYYDEAASLNGDSAYFMRNGFDAINALLGLADIALRLHAAEQAEPKPVMQEWPLCSSFDPERPAQRCARLAGHPGSRHSDGKGRAW